MKVVSARGGTLTSWQGARVDNRLSHPALVDRVMTIYLQNENVVNGSINKELIKKALNEYKSQVDEKTYITMASWVMRSTSGSIFIDSSNEIHPGTIRTWLAKDGVKLSRYGTRTARISKGLTSHASKLFPTSKLGDPDVIAYLTDVDAIDKYFEPGITVAEYKNMEPGQSFKHVAKMKISNLSDTANVMINNHSIIEMSDDEVHNIYEQLNEDEYVDLIASFAEVWHNILTK